MVKIRFNLSTTRRVSSEGRASCLCPPSHEQLSLLVLCPKADLTHFVDGKILPRAGVYKDLRNALLRKAVMGHRLHGFLVIIALAMRVGMTVSMAIIVVICMWPVWQEVDDHQDTSWLEPGDEAFRGELGVVEMMEAETHACHVEVEEFRVPERFWGRITGRADIATERGHLVPRKALEEKTSVRTKLPYRNVRRLAERVCRFRVPKSTNTNDLGRARWLTWFLARAL